MPPPAPVKNCSTCAYFLKLPPSDQDGKGLCRYDAPRTVNNYVEPNTSDGRWAICFETEWCGKWENK